jgi:hypothetical protein
MLIAFNFQYIHDNGLFIRLLNRIEELSNISLSFYEEDNRYKIVAEGDQVDLESLAELISTVVPKSLFLKEYKIEKIDKEDLEGESSLSQRNTLFKVPYCPECQENVVKTFDPFIPCSVCGFNETPLCMDDLTSFTGITTTSNKDFFLQLANIFREKGEITLPTYNGIRRFSQLNSEHKSKGILFCDPSNISDKFLITQGELDSLMMVEKPTVRLKAKLKFRVEYDLNEPFYPVFFADDKITLAFTTALKSLGFDTVFCDHVPALRVASALEQHLIITTGRDMLPWKIDYDLIKHASFCEYGGYQAYGNANGLQVSTKLNLNNQPYIEYVANDEVSEITSAIRFEPAHGAMRSIVIEHSLKDPALCGIHLSKDHTSHFFSFSNKIGYTPMVLFRDGDITQPRHMLEAISSMDDSGMRLVNNFKDKFPELYGKIEQTNFTTHTDISDITKIWSMAAVFIGLYDGDNALKSCEVLETTAIEFNGKSGPRIDYKVISTEEGYQLDLRLAIRSAISFKLAGLDDYLLSFGFIDSLADFIAQQAEDADANIGINGVTLSGSLFENRQLLMRTYNGLSVNYTIYRNERLSIDNANVALGAITLGSE